MDYVIYQIPVTETIVQDAELGDAHARRIISAWRDSNLGRFNYENLRLYRKVAICRAETLDQVFLVMNRWDEQDRNSVKLLPPNKVRSLSVGDIVAENSTVHLVAPIGFEDITSKASQYFSNQGAI